MSNQGIKVICGPMFSGKTTELLRLVKVWKLSKKKVQLFKHSSDDRYDTTKVSTHDKTMMEAIPVLSSYDIKEHLEEDVDVVFIDEIQFFDEGVISLCEELANKGKLVIVCGLDMDFKSEPFYITSWLMAKAEEVTKLSAVCLRCGKLATKSYRKDKDNKSIIDVGESDKYESLCRQCYYELTKDDPKEKEEDFEEGCCCCSGCGCCCEGKDKAA